MQYDYFGFIVAALIAIGGAIGYFKAGKRIAEKFSNLESTKLLNN